MNVAIVQVQHAPARDIIRDRSGVIIGVIERQHLVGKLVARDRHGTVVGAYEERSRTTRDAHGRIVGRTNLLPALLLQRR